MAFQTAGASHRGPPSISSSRTTAMFVVIVALHIVMGYLHGATHLPGRDLP